MKNILKYFTDLRKDLKLQYKAFCEAFGKNFPKKMVESNISKEEFKQEVQRKIFHIITIAIIPVSYIFLSKETMLQIILPIALLIITADFLRHKISFINKIFLFSFGHILREKELRNKSWTGASYMSIAAIIIFSLCPKSIAICSFGILAVSDCLAALVGKKMTSREFYEKSAAGSIAFGISAWIILLICGIFTGQTFIYYVFGTIAVIATTIIEARPSLLDFDDNLTIPASFAGIMMFFAIIWDLTY